MPRCGCVCVGGWPIHLWGTEKKEGLRGDSEDGEKRTHHETVEEEEAGPTDDRTQSSAFFAEEPLRRLLAPKKSATDTR